METAETVIRDALEERGAIGAEEPLEATDAQLAIRYLNRLMEELSAHGINLGYTSVSTLASPITVPAGAVSAIVKNLGASLPSSFGGEVTPLLLQQAEDGKKAMRKIAIVVKPSQYPSTMPMGVANENDYCNQHFYPEPAEEVSTEYNSAIQVEDNTEDTDA